MEQFSENLNTLHIRNSNLQKQRQQFFKEANIDSIFAPISKINRSKSLKFYGGLSWLYFSRKIIDLLEFVASQASLDFMKKNISAILEDEIGLKGEQAHFEMYEDALKRVYLKETDYSIASQWKSSLAFEQLLNETKSESCEYFNLGLILGLEIPANENIEMSLRIICNEEEEQEISKMKYFLVHMVAEDEHINRNVLNYLNLTSMVQRSQYLKGFRRGVDFWNIYWHKVAEKVTQNG